MIRTSRYPQEVRDKYPWQGGVPSLRTTNCPDPEVPFAHRPRPSSTAGDNKLPPYLIKDLSQYKSPGKRLGHLFFHRNRTHLPSLDREINPNPRDLGRSPSSFLRDCGFSFVSRPFRRRFLSVCLLSVFYLLYQFPVF